LNVEAISLFQIEPFQIPEPMIFTYGLIQGERRFLLVVNVTHRNDTLPH